MQCPVCSERLREVQKNGVLLSVCADCKGGWMDKPELEKLFAGVGERPARSRDDHDSRPDDRQYRSRDEHDRDNGSDPEDDRYSSRKVSYDKDGRPRKREGFLGNIMDMFGD